MCMCLHPLHPLLQTDGGAAQSTGQDFVKKCGKCQRKKDGNYMWLLFKGPGVDVEVVL